MLLKAKEVVTVRENRCVQFLIGECTKLVCSCLFVVLFDYLFQLLPQIWNKLCHLPDGKPIPFIMHQQHIQEKGSLKLLNIQLIKQRISMWKTSLM